MGNERGVFVLGHDLPDGTDLYYLDWSDSILRDITPNTSSQRFWFIHETLPEGDGLYATPAVRKFWRINRSIHPHCTLFEMLRSIIDIA